MKKITAKDFDEIRLWVHRNARPVDLALWQYEFEEGGPEAVLSALSAYQNGDGGFGHALEADCWNPESSPYTTLSAIGRLQNIRHTDAEHPIMQGILKFLHSGTHSTAAGWLFSIPSNNGYARAPWWTYDPKANEYEHLGVTAGLVCFILEFAPKDGDLYKRACGFTHKLLERYKDTDQKGDMGLGGYCQLLSTVTRLGLTDQFDMEYLSGSIKNLVDQAIERDVSKWADYGVRPSQFIQTPESPFYQGNEDIVQTELDYLIDTRSPGGVWGITWKWWELYEAYPKEFAISENWWKADYQMGATGKLKFLRSFGRLG